MASTCYCPDCPEPEPQIEWGLRPVYSNELADIVQLESVRDLINPGKIYIYGNLLLISERYKGVHFFDNSDPISPKPLYFLSILGNLDVAIRNDILYADQGRNIVSINLKTIDSKNIEIERVNNVRYSDYYTFEEPPEKNVYYECPDALLGRVVSWEYDSIYYPCYKGN